MMDTNTDFFVHRDPESYRLQHRPMRGIWMTVLVSFGAFLGAISCINLLILSIADIGPLLEQCLLFACVEICFVAMVCWLLAGGIWTVGKINDAWAYARSSYFGLTFAILLHAWCRRFKVM